MTTKFLTPTDLSDDFIVAPDKKVHRVKSTKFYTGVYGSNTLSGGNDDGWGRKLTISDNLGIIHLDFKWTNAYITSGTILTLPDAAPTPINKLEVQTSDGTLVYIDAGTRTVRCSGPSANRRHIVDLIGFFQ